MPLEIVTIPCLSDNYAYLAHDAATGATTLIDIPEAGPILGVLDRRGWALDQILITHHHWDHIDGLQDILQHHKARVVGGRDDSHRLPPLDQAVGEGDTVQIGDVSGVVLDVSGHTLGHLAFHFPEAEVVFTADSLMALGCGRLFEGTPAQMWESLRKLAALPANTLVCSGHEYTESNGRFALTIDPANQALQQRMAQVAEHRAAGQPTVPSRLSEEMATNPFLRADDPMIREALGLQSASAEAVFTEIRRLKDNF